MYTNRSIAYSHPTRKTVPYFLNTYRNTHDEHESLRMLMFGKPGAGKGTLTSWLANKYDISTVSTGDLLRQHIAARTEVGQQAEGIVARGGLLPDEVILKVVTTKLDSLHNRVCPKSSFVLVLMSPTAPLGIALDPRWISAHARPS